jgi:hypothetical protein
VRRARWSAECLGDVVEAEETARLGSRRTPLMTTSPHVTQLRLRGTL